MNEPRNEWGSVTVALPALRRQLLTLAKVHGQSSDYYRAALMPVIKAAVARLEGLQCTKMYIDVHCGERGTLANPSPDVDPNLFCRPGHPEKCS